MPAKVHRIVLEQSEVAKLEQIVRNGVHQARVITRARILLMANENGPNKTDAFIQEALSISRSTTARVRKRYTTRGGIEGALHDAPRPGAEKILSEAEECRVIAIACSDPPKGRSSWTMDLIAQEATRQLGKPVKRGVVWKTLDKSEQKPWREKNVVHTTGR